MNFFNWNKKEEVSENEKFSRIKVSKLKYRFIMPNDISHYGDFNYKLQTIIAMTNQWVDLYNKSDFSYNGEYKTKTWSFIDESDNYFFVISAPGRGTSIESSLDLKDYFETGKLQKETKAKINSFISFLYEDLLTLNDEKVKTYTKLFNK